MWCTWRCGECECDVRSYECFCQNRIGQEPIEDKSTCNCDGSCEKGKEETKCHDELVLLAEALRTILIKVDNIERMTEKMYRR